MDWKDLLPWKRWRTKRPQAGAGEVAPVAIQRDVDRAFERFRKNVLPDLAGNVFGDSAWGALPRVDVREGAKGIEVAIDVPGLTEDDLQLSLSPAGDELILRGECRGESTDEDDHGWRRAERFRGTLHRSVRLPCRVHLSGATARLKHGVLRVALKKRDASPDATRIPISKG